MNKLLFAFAVFATALTSCASSPPVSSLVEPVCPQAISAKQTLSEPVPGWEAMEDDAPLQLANVVLFEGHPREKAALVPDQEVEVDGRQVSTWMLVDNGNLHYWIACRYDHSSIVLTRPIGSGVETCEVTRDLQITIAGQPAIVDIKFR
jgi:hypothetical protein